MSKLFVDAEAAVWAAGAIVSAASADAAMAEEQSPTRREVFAKRVELAKRVARALTPVSEGGEAIETMALDVDHIVKGTLWTGNLWEDERAIEAVASFPTIRDYTVPELRREKAAFLLRTIARALGLEVEE